jgi:putative transcription factor|tara:strand:- start:5205 stop:5624 length:420 start_codon:yes stop_codon:yes gene_type:complete
MECELCGKVIQNPRKTSVEGSILTVCEGCVKYGNEVQFSKPKPAEETGQTSSYTPYVRKVNMPYSGEIEQGDELADDYNKRIQQAWNKSGKKLDEFARMLNEKSSVISKLISKSMTPDDKLLKKLEKKLNIKLREPSED